MKFSKVAFYSFCCISILYLSNRVFVFGEWISLLKPFIMLSLLMYFISMARPLTRKAYFIVAALVFSLLGDLALMFDSDMAFMLGLGSFLVAHLLYIFWFYQMVKGQLSIRDLKSSSFFIMVLMIFLIYIFQIILPLAGDLMLPVSLYGICITAMGSMAIVVHQHIRQRFTRMMAIGSVLFILSDTILAMEKFYMEEVAFFIPFWIMLTYILGQFMIASGAINYLTHKKG